MSSFGVRRRVGYAVLKAGWQSELLSRTTSITNADLAILCARRWSTTALAQGKSVRVVGEHALSVWAVIWPLGDHHFVEVMDFIPQTPPVDGFVA